MKDAKGGKSQLKAGFVLFDFYKFYFDKIGNLKIVNTTKYYYFHFAPLVSTAFALLPTLTLLLTLSLAVFFCNSIF